MKRLAFVLLALFLGLTACRDETTSPSAESSPQLTQGSSRMLSGWFPTQWGDPRGGRGTARMHHELIDDPGYATELALDEGLAAGLGLPLALDGKRVRIDGEAVSTRRVQVHSLELERTPEPAGAAGVEPAAVSRIRSYPT